MKILQILFIILFLLVLLFFPIVNAALIDNVVSYYKFEDNAANTIVVDAVGTNDGTSSTNTNNLNTIGIIDDGFDFTSEEIDSNFALSTSALTLNGWIHPDGFGGDYGVVATTDASHTNGLNVLTESGPPGVMKVQIWNGGGRVDIISAGTFTDAQWNMWTVTWDGTTWRLYINGGADGISTASLSSHEANLEIGRFHRGSANYNGQMDEIGIWNRELTSSEVTELYASGSPGTAQQYPFSVDTCSCPGLNNNWEIDMSDNCIIVDACDLGTGTLSFTGIGWCKCNAAIDTTNLGDPGSGGTLFIQNLCSITID